jgi:hypothetical protein
MNCSRKGPKLGNGHVDFRQIILKEPGGDADEHGVTGPRTNWLRRRNENGSHNPLSPRMFRPAIVTGTVSRFLVSRLEAI